MAEYHGIRARLLNSSALLKETSLVPFHINETTLTRWYKGIVRMEEIKTLLQGLHIPPPPPAKASEPLPAARVLLLRHQLCGTHLFSRSRGTITLCLVLSRYLRQLQVLNDHRRPRHAFADDSALVLLRFFKVF